jgi:GNAT superfamily N-acetyltransferase
MSVHGELAAIPDFHIFEGLGLSVEQPIASINRLVVHSDFRWLGLSRELDALRLDAARKVGCRTMTALASKLSGIKRLQALQKLGFRPVAPAYSLRNWDWVTPLVMSLQP